MQNLGKAVLMMGLVLVIIGAVLIIAGKFGLPFGKLPGDITYQRKNITVFAPLGTMFLISLVASLILNIFSRWR